MTERPARWNTDPTNPAAIARQRRSGELTRQYMADPQYVRDLQRLREAVARMPPPPERRR